MNRFLAFLEKSVEHHLTKRKRIKAFESERKHTILSEIWSWVDALIFAIFWVIIINQYLFQLFVIPSPSMVGTLDVGDRVIVNKDAYGVELYPAGNKVFTDNRRVQLVNIDKNDDGTPAERLYVKRAVGMGGDEINFQNGNVVIKASGTDEYLKEEDFRDALSLAEGPHRSVDPVYYDGLKAAAALTSYDENGYASYAPQHLIRDYSELRGSGYDYIFDRYEFERSRTRTAYSFNPSDMDKRSDAAVYDNGIYVPEGKVLPLGDNRDNSNDGRYFGPVDETRINGRVIGRFWPITRISSLLDNH